MKVLLCAPYYLPEHAGRYVAGAFDENRCEVTVFDYRSLTMRLGDAFKMNQLLLKVAKKTSPDFVLVLKGELFQSRTFKKMDLTTALWFFDPETPKWLMDLAKEFDYFFLHIPAKKYIELYKEQGINVHFLPQAVAPSVHYPINVSDEESETYGADVSFIGSRKPVREEWLKEVFDRGYNLRVWGNFWNGSPLEKVWGGKPVYHEEFSKVCASSKIVLGIGYGPYIKHDISARLYMALGCKAFHLTNYVEGLEKLYNIGEEVATYNGKEEMFQKIDFFLAHSQERVKISQAGYERTLKEHTYTQRIKELMKICGLT